MENPCLQNPKNVKKNAEISPNNEPRFPKTEKKQAVKRKADKKSIS